MSLQRRLTLFFVIIVVLPLAAAGIVVQRVVASEIEHRAGLALAPAINATVVVYNQRSELLPDLVERAVKDPSLSALLDSHDEEGVEEFLTQAMGESQGIDFLIVMDRGGRILGEAHHETTFVPGYEPPTTGEILTSETTSGPGFTRTVPREVKVPGSGVVGTVVGGFWMDRDLLVASSDEDVDLSIVADGELIASTARVESPIRIDVGPGNESFDADIDGDSKAQAQLIPGSDIAFVASTPTGPINARSGQVFAYMAAVLLLAVLLTAVLAYWLARLITQPLNELSAGASAIAEGRFDHRMPVRSRDEVGQLAMAFNDMTDHLRERDTQLSSSRNQLERAIRRVGETLRSTHDRRQLLERMIDTAAEAVDADAAVVWMFTPTRDELYPVLGRGLEIESLDRTRIGQGIVGFVAERASTVWLPSSGGGPKPSGGEPPFPLTIAVPLHSQDRIAGVLSVYRREQGKPFTRADLDTVVFLVETGGVAIENVSLHEEAQRLSLSDGLTGVWNRRYFQMQFRQVLATSIRFERPFSILMLDLDHFKRVNDTFGHQRGDAILIDFSQRVREALREVDHFARYGGEEFICLLSETDSYGAMTTAEKIRDAIRSQPFGSMGDDKVQLTVSIGAASYPDHGDSYNQLVAAADQALYRAKQDGRDRVRLAGEQPPPPLKLAN